jgi:hypothetical protein
MADPVASTTGVASIIGSPRPASRPSRNSSTSTPLAFAMSSSEHCGGAAKKTTSSSGAPATTTSERLRALLVRSRNGE